MRMRVRAVSVTSVRKYQAYLVEINKTDGASKDSICKKLDIGDAKNIKNWQDAIQLAEENGLNLCLDVYANITSLSTKEVTQWLKSRCENVPIPDALLYTTLYS